MKSHYIVVLLLIALVTFSFTACKGQQQTEPIAKPELEKLGKVDFPTSCLSDAQKHFLIGVAALHSFWYPVAAEEFQTSTKIDPNCTMGYWGEAMSYNHPIWGDPQETAAARKVLKKIEKNQKVTAQERAWLDAVEVLYGDGEKEARDKAYEEAMEKMYRQYPDDSEVGLFYALALMGTVHASDPAGEKVRLQAGEIASRIFEKKPDHPGAAHYILHAYDDPKHAELALPAAKRYAQIAPAAPHALHMPSHIFLQLGMWPEAAASNEESWSASEKWVKLKNLPSGQLDFHSLHWLTYVYLQQGRYKQAEQLIAKMRESVSKVQEDDFRGMLYGKMTLANVASAFLTETERWNEVDQILGSTQIEIGDTKAPGIGPMKVYALVASIPVVFARGMAAATKNSKEAQKAVEELRSIPEQTSEAKEPFVKDAVRVTEIQTLEIEAMKAAAKNNLDEAIKLMQRATALEQKTPPPPGPPILIKPSNEFFGEILLRAGRPKEAEEQFAISLQRHRNRARSLLGAARAAIQNGDTEKGTKYYTAFLRQWQKSDSELAELNEARKYSSQNKVGS